MNGIVQFMDENFLGFIFKIQVNMNLVYCDCIVFVCVCLGKFECGMNVMLVRMNCKMKLVQFYQFLVLSCEIVDIVYFGDIIGLYDLGMYQIGDIIVGEGKVFEFDVFLKFLFELFVKVCVKNVMKFKYFEKGINQFV